jgi:hypothetical protein
LIEALDRLWNHKLQPTLIILAGLGDLLSAAAAVQAHALQQKIGCGHGRGTVSKLPVLPQCLPL